MKQIEYDEKIREMRKERTKEIGGLKPIIEELNIKINELGSQQHRIAAEQKQLIVQRSMMRKRVNQIEEKWNSSIRLFRRDNPYDELESKLEDVSDFCIVNELVRRGFHGTIDNDDRTEEAMAIIRSKFAGGGIIGEQQHEATE